ncbi:MAG: hypothetical protein IKT29_07190 [Flavobacteriales bacterium]|nr:hypothetical protein [Flavobacteriales bacterium]
MNTPTPKRHFFPSKSSSKTFKKRPSASYDPSLKNFSRLSSEIHIYGIDDPMTIEHAIEHSIRILLNNHLPTDEHLQNIWIADTRGITRVWEMSETAYRLTLINLASQSPRLSQMLIRHIKFFK